MKIQLTSYEWGKKKDEIYREIDGKLGTLLLFMERSYNAPFLRNHTVNAIANSIMYANYETVKRARGELRENEFPGVGLRWQRVKRVNPIPEMAKTNWEDLELDLPF